MYKLIEWIRLLTMSTDQYLTNANEMSSNVFYDNTVQSTVNKKRHAKYLQLCLDVLPPRVSAHDSTRFVFA